MCTADIGSNATVTVITSNRMEVLLGILGTQTDRGDPTTANSELYVNNAMLRYGNGTVDV